MNETSDLIDQYYDAFNRQDKKTLLSFLSDDVVHDINQGERQIGITEFSMFMDHMFTCYQEKVLDLVIMTNVQGTRAASEFFIEGKYLVTDEGFPAANQQAYRLQVGAFFNIKNNKITRVTNYYNLQDWINQVSQ